MLTVKVDFFLSCKIGEIDPEKEYNPPNKQEPMSREREGAQNILQALRYFAWKQIHFPFQV